MIHSALIAKNPRHAELVSASIHPQARQRRNSQRWTKVNPMRVLAFDKVDFPLAMPALQLFFVDYCPVHVCEQLIANENMNGVATGKAGQSPVAMLVQTGGESERNADVQRSMALTGPDVNAGLFIQHGAECGSRWMLKQVQHDGGGSYSIRETSCAIGFPPPTTVPPLLASGRKEL